MLCAIYCICKWPERPDLKWSNALCQNVTVQYSSAARCVCAVHNRWRVEMKRSGEWWQLTAVPTLASGPSGPLVPGESDAGAGLLLMMFASWHLLSARHHQPACQHQTEKLGEFINFDIDAHQYSLYSEFFLISPSIWRIFADNYPKFSRKDYIQMPSEHSALW